MTNESTLLPTSTIQTLRESMDSECADFTLNEIKRYQRHDEDGAIEQTKRIHYLLMTEPFPSVRALHIGKVEL